MSSWICLMRQGKGIRNHAGVIQAIGGERNPGASDGEGVSK